MFDGQQRMMNGAVGPGPGMMHLGGNAQQPFGPTDHMDPQQQPPHWLPKVDQHNNLWDSHLHNMDDKHSSNMVCLK